MKICFFITTVTKGGAERVIANLSNYLVNEENIENVDIINIYNTEISYDLDPKIKVYTIEKKFVKHQNLMNNHKGLVKFIKHVAKYIKNIHRKHILKNMLNKSDYDVIISFLPEPSFMILSLKKYIKCPIIVSDRNDPNLEYNNIRTKYLMKKLYPLADGFVFQTLDAKRYFDKLFTKKNQIIFNPVNKNFIRESYIGEREKTIVNVGRLENQKNQMLLIKAFEKIKDEFNEYKLIIYGDGTLKKSLQDYITNNNLTERVILAGEVEDLNEKIYKSSLFVLSSDYEGMPNALIEAMCLGIPVISTDCPCGGPRMLIDNNENGLLVEVNNQEQLSEAIKKILSNNEYAKELGIKASRLSEKVSSDVIDKEWLEFIKKIIKGVI